MWVNDEGGEEFYSSGKLDERIFESLFGDLYRCRGLVHDGRLAVVLTSGSARRPGLLMVLSR